MSEVAKKVELEELIENLSTKDRLLQLDAFLIHNEQVECPLEHIFLENLYIREVFIPAGTLFTTYVHKTENAFFIMMGELLIWDEKNKWQRINSPYRGITKKGTKRVCYAISDVVWNTTHYNPDNCRDISVLEKRLFKNYSNPYLSLKELELIQK